ncbi:MAG: universal stress protein [Chromatiaceae bacterium]|nr:universal stress protein [Gammaproteobacteria bacterium]MCB1873527.1 universal stress protein [Gammaproteobacteria bacterium]MCP5445703.1 universal stress protein [Chromatiaceae bacterium]
MFKDILIPINLGDEATWKNPLKTGIELAQTMGATLHLMTVVPSFDYPIVESYFPVDFEQKAQQKVNSEMHKFIAERIPKGVKHQLIVAVGAISEQIMDAADATKCDLIIMSRRGRPRRHFTLGSNVNKVVHHATTPVLVLD